MLESLEHAQKRGVPIIAELVGYGATSDGYDMVKPSGEGAVRVCVRALQGVAPPIQYVNTHGTSTPAGDVIELEAIKQALGEHDPWISSTKSLSGHALGRAGVNESIYTLLMMQSGFVSASANVHTLDAAAQGHKIATERVDDVDLQLAMSNSFGFGGHQLLAGVCKMA